MNKKKKEIKSFSTEKRERGRQNRGNHTKVHNKPFNRDSSSTDAILEASQQYVLVVISHF